MDGTYDWNAAIAVKRKVLIGIVASLLSLVGLVEGGPVVERVTRRVRRLVLIALQPAESALRRLIFAKAKDMPLEFVERQTREVDTAKACTLGQGFSKNRRRKKPKRKRGDGVPPFALFDPRVDSEAQRRRRWRVEPEQYGDDLLDATRLTARLLSLHRALGDMTRETHRMMRAMARRKRGPSHLQLQGPLRPAYPPGYRQEHIHRVDEFLQDCQRLALKAEHHRWLNSS